MGWWLVVLFAVVRPELVDAHAYRNCSTTESAHNDDTNVYLCEDFEVNGGGTVNGKGKWYAENAETATTNGGINTRTKGWAGTIFAEPITPDGAEICSVAVPGGSCAGHHGSDPRVMGGGNMADHSLMTSTDTFTPQNHVFVRYYQKWLTGYTSSQEKVLTFNRGPARVAGIWWGNLHLNCGGNSDGTGLTALLQWQPKNSSIPTTPCLTVPTGVGDNRLTSGVWWGIQIELDLGTGSSDGALRIYLDNCGANGDQCTGTPTLRLERTGVSFTNAGTDNLGSLWFENWCNDCTGTSYIDQIVVRDGSQGLIPFVGVTAGATTYGLFLSSWVGWLVTLNTVLQLAMFAGYFWSQRAAVERAAVRVWLFARMLPTPHDLYWIMVYRLAVKRWQRQAPLLLPPPDQKYSIPLPTPQQTERR